MARRLGQESRRSPTQDFGKDLLSVSAIPVPAIARLLESARKLKALRHKGARHQPLAGMTLGLLFEKPSTRTRVSFETGMHQLGGQSLFLSLDNIQLSRGETIAVHAAQSVSAARIAQLEPDSIAAVAITASSTLRRHTSSSRSREPRRSTIGARRGRFTRPWACPSSGWWT